MKMFRTLRADEIDCRVAQLYPKSSTCTLLLYKDARCDMNILDETVGPENWQRAHELIDGQLFCNVGIWIDRRKDGYGEWVWRQDVGTESYTEAEKGRASDSFKRACVNWGIGRELYTAPKIVVPCNVKEVNGKLKTYDTFKVASIGYDEAGNINALTITHDGVVVYELKAPEGPTALHFIALREDMVEKGITEAQICERYGLQRLEDMSMETYARAVKAIEKSGGK